MEIPLNINGRSEIIIALPTDNLRDALRRAGYYSARYGSDDGATGASAIPVSYTHLRAHET